MEVDETKLKQERKNCLQRVRSGTQKILALLAKAIWKIFDEDDHLVVHPASLHSLISFVKVLFFFCFFFLFFCFFFVLFFCFFLVSLMFVCVVYTLFSFKKK